MANLTLYIAAGAAALGGFLSWHFQAARLGADIAELKVAASQYKLDIAEERRASDRRVFATSEKIHVHYGEALNDALTKQAALKDAAAVATRNSGRLREQLSAAERRAKTAPEAAVRDYAAAASVVLGKCVDRYIWVASRADGHALDAATCRAAWPVADK